MKLLVISDTHIPLRNKMNLYDFLQGKKYDFLVHCGDFTDYDSFQLCKLLAGDKLLAVYGNCDPETIRTELPTKLNVKIRGRNILILHSFNVYPRGNKEQLLEQAIENNAEILFYGHTHKQLIHYYDKKKKEFFIDDKLNFDENRIYFINPGSLIDDKYLFIDLD